MSENPYGNAASLWSELSTTSLDGKDRAYQQPPTDNLPFQLIPFIGREKEIGEISNLLSQPDLRLVTLYGLGGTGKTRTAIETARRVKDLFLEGVWFVSLTPVTSAEYVYDSICSALGLSYSGYADRKSQLFHYLNPRSILLVLDNLEHLLPEISQSVGAILEAAPDVKILATTRQRLDKAGEAAYRLGGLDLPPESNGEEIQTTDALALFLHHLYSHGYPLAAAELPDAGRVCRLVEGMPLALVLAASWGRVLSIADIAREIEQGIDILEIAGQSIPDKHRSMRVVFEHSWNALSGEEKSALTRLSVFSGGFDREAAAEVGGATPRRLASLIDKALIERDEKHRFHIHELLRQFLYDQIVKTREEEEARAAALDYFLKLAERAESELRGSDQVAWVDRLEVEWNNIREILSWCVGAHEISGPAALGGLRLIVLLERFWFVRGHWQEIGYFLEKLDGLAAADRGLDARGKYLAGLLARLVEDLPKAYRRSQEALEVARESGAPLLTGLALWGLGRVACDLGQFLDARRFLQESLALFRESDHLEGVCLALNGLGITEENAGNLAAARPYALECRALLKKSPDRHLTVWNLEVLSLIALRDIKNSLPQARGYLEEGMVDARRLGMKKSFAFFLNGLADLCLYEGRYELAQAYYAEGVQIFNELGGQNNLVSMIISLGFACLGPGDTAEAKRHFIDGLNLCMDHNTFAGEIAVSFMGLAGVYAAEGEIYRAARIFGGTDARKDEILAYPPEEVTYERIRTSIRSQMSKDIYARLYEAGRTTDLQELIEYAIAPGVDVKYDLESVASLEAPADLTAREVEILHLIAQGFSDKQIAETLFISPRTVNAHLTSIYSKLGVNSRAAATRFAVDNGLA